MFNSFFKFFFFYLLFLFGFITNEGLLILQIQHQEASPIQCFTNRVLCLAEFLENPHLPDYNSMKIENDTLFLHFFNLDSCITHKFSL